MARCQRWRWVRWTRSRGGLFVVGRLAWYRTSIDGISRKGKVSVAVKGVETPIGVWEIKDEVTDFALGGVRVELQVEDCANVVWGDNGPLH